MVVLLLNGERGGLIIPRINLRCLSIQIHQEQLPVLTTAARNRSSLHCSEPGRTGSPWGVMTIGACSILFCGHSRVMSRERVFKAVPDAMGERLFVIA